MNIIELANKLELTVGDVKRMCKLGIIKMSNVVTGSNNVLSTKKTVISEFEYKRLRSIIPKPVMSAGLSPNSVLCDVEIARMFSIDISSAVELVNASFMHQKDGYCKAGRVYSYFGRLYALYDEEDRLADIDTFIETERSLCKKLRISEDTLNSGIFKKIFIASKSKKYDITKVWDLLDVYHDESYFILNGVPADFLNSFALCKESQWLRKRGTRLWKELTLLYYISGSFLPDFMELKYAEKAINANFTVVRYKDKEYVSRNEVEKLKSSGGVHKHVITKAVASQLNLSEGDVVKACESGIIKHIKVKGSILVSDTVLSNIDFILGDFVLPEYSDNLFVNAPVLSKLFGVETADIRDLLDTGIITTVTRNGQVNADLRQVQYYYKRLDSFMGVERECEFSLSLKEAAYVLKIREATVSYLVKSSKLQVSDGLFLNKDVLAMSKFYVDKSLFQKFGISSQLYTKYMAWGEEHGVFNSCLGYWSDSSIEFFKSGEWLDSFIASTTALELYNITDRIFDSIVIRYGLRHIKYNDIMYFDSEEVERYISKYKEDNTIEDNSIVVADESDSNKVIPVKCQVKESSEKCTGGGINLSSPDYKRRIDELVENISIDIIKDISSSDRTMLKTLRSEGVLSDLGDSDLDEYSKKLHLTKYDVNYIHKNGIADLSSISDTLGALKTKDADTEYKRYISPYLVMKLYNITREEFDSLVDSELCEIKIFASNMKVCKNDLDLYYERLAKVDKVRVFKGEGFILSESDVYELCHNISTTRLTKVKELGYLKDKNGRYDVDEVLHLSKFYVPLAELQRCGVDRAFSSSYKDYAKNLDLYSPVNLCYTESSIDFFKSGKALEGFIKEASVLEKYNIDANKLKHMSANNIIIRVTNNGISYYNEADLDTALKENSYLTDYDISVKDAQAKYGVDVLELQESVGIDNLTVMQIGAKKYVRSADIEMYKNSSELRVSDSIPLRRQDSKLTMSEVAEILGVLVEDLDMLPTEKLRCEVFTSVHGARRVYNRDEVNVFKMDMTCHVKQNPDNGVVMTDELVNKYYGLHKPIIRSCVDSGIFGGKIVDEYIVGIKKNEVEYYCEKLAYIYNCGVYNRGYRLTKEDVSDLLLISENEVDNLPKTVEYKLIGGHKRFSIESVEKYIRCVSSKLDNDDGHMVRVDETRNDYPTANSEECTISVKEASEILCISPPTVRDMIREGKLRYTCRSNRYYLSQEILKYDVRNYGITETDARRYLGLQSRKWKRKIAEKKIPYKMSITGKLCFNENDLVEYKKHNS